MSKLRFVISLSLDGFVAGPEQSVQNPLGIGGERLHEWAFALEIFRKAHDMEGGEVNASTAIVEEWLANVGAGVMGRNMFGGHPGPWDAHNPWTGWWGTNPPFHYPVYVLTHHARPVLELEGGNSFTFVTDGIESALDQARRAAKGKDVLLSGGARTAQQYLARGLVDEMILCVVPTLLGSGERLFEGLGTELHGLRLVKTASTPQVVHLKFARG